MSNTEQLKQNVIDALDALMSDTSVDPETTLEAMEEIESEVYMKTVALKEDIQRRG